MTILLSIKHIKAKACDFFNSEHKGLIGSKKRGNVCLFFVFIDSQMVAQK